MSGKIVVGTDGSVSAAAAVEWAADDAARRQADLRITTVVERWPYGVARYPAPPEVGEALIRGARRVLAEAEACALKRQPAITVTTEIIEGYPASVLGEQAEDATELVVGSRGLGGFAGALLGSVSGHVAGHARGVVVVVRPHADGAGERHGPYGEVVVGMDDSAACEPALAYAFEQARLRDATLRAVHAWQMPVHVYGPGIPYDMDEIRQAQQRIVTGKLDAIRGGFPDVTVIEDIQCAHPVDTLTQASRKADLVVVGSHGRGAIGSLFLGSVSRGLLHHSRCPVAVARA